MNNNEANFCKRCKCHKPAECFIVTNGLLGTEKIYKSCQRCRDHCLNAWHIKKDPNYVPNIDTIAPAGKPGRPKGSLGKLGRSPTPVEPLAASACIDDPDQVPKRKPGRPKGSLGKLGRSPIHQATLEPAIVLVE